MIKLTDVKKLAPVFLEHSGARIRTKIIRTPLKTEKCLFKLPWKIRCKPAGNQAHQDMWPPGHAADSKSPQDFYHFGNSGHSGFPVGLLIL